MGHAHLQFALPKSGRPDAAPYFGSDFVVIVIDAHIGLQMGNSNAGLSYVFSIREDHVPGVLCLRAGVIALFAGGLILLRLFRAFPDGFATG